MAKLLVKCLFTVVERLEKVVERLAIVVERFVDVGLRIGERGRG